MVQHFPFISDLERIHLRRRFHYNGRYGRRGFFQFFPRHRSSSPPVFVVLPRSSPYRNRADTHFPPTLPTIRRSSCTAKWRWVEATGGRRYLFKNGLLLASRQNRSRNSLLLLLLLDGRTPLMTGRNTNRGNCVNGK